MSNSTQAKKKQEDPASSSFDTSEDLSLNPGKDIVRTMIFSAQFTNLDLVREFVKEAAELCELDASAVYAAQLAVDEATSNIIEHSYGGESLNEIECTCQIKTNCLVIRLRDCGNAFEPSLVPVPDLEAELKDRDVGGLGLYFIHQLMDEVAFEFDHDQRTGKKCNVLRMIKYKEK